MIKRFLGRYNVSLVLILLVGAALRFYGLSIQSLWGDELVSWLFIDVQSVVAVAKKAAGDTWPPGYFVLLYGWQKLFANSEWALRFPSAVAGFLAIPAIYFLGRRLYGQKEGLIAAGLIAVLWYPMFYSQEARAYSMLMLGAIVTTYAWWTLLHLTDGKKAWRWWGFAYIVTAAGMMYLHYFGLLLVGLQCVGAAALSICRPQLRRRFVATFSVIAVLYLPWMPVLLWQVLNRRGKIAWIPQPDIVAFWKFVEFAFEPSFLLAVASAIAIALLLALEIIRWWRHQGRAPDILLNPTFMLSLWFSMPLLIVFIESWLWTSLFLSRYLLISAPPLYLLLARAVTQFARPLALQLMVAAGIVAFSLWHLIVVQAYYTHPHKPQIREAVAYVSETSFDSQKELVVVRIWFPESLNYYFQKLNSPKRVDVGFDSSRRAEPISKRIIQTRSDYVWFVELQRPIPSGLENYLENSYEMIARREFYKVNVSLFRHRSKTTDGRDLPKVLSKDLSKHVRYKEIDFR